MPIRIRSRAPAVSAASSAACCCMRSAARTARSASSSWATGAPNSATMASPMILSTWPPKATTSAARRSKQSSTRFLTCLGVERLGQRGEADEVGEEHGDDAALVGARRQRPCPHEGQNRAPAGASAPHDGQVMTNAFYGPTSDESRGCDFRFVRCSARRLGPQPIAWWADRREGADFPHVNPQRGDRTRPPSRHGRARAIDAVKIYGKGDTEVRALDGVTVEFATGAFTAIMGPSGSGKSTLHALPGRARHAHVAARSSSATSTSARSTTSAAHAAAPRPDRLRLPGLQPGAHADRDGEHHAAARPRRPQARPGVARPGDRHASACATG